MSMKRKAKHAEQQYLPVLNERENTRFCRMGSMTQCIRDLCNKSNKGVMHAESWLKIKLNSPSFG